MTLEKKILECDETISLLRQQLTTHKNEIRALTGRVAILEVFLGEKLSLIPDYTLLCADEYENVLNTISQWVLNGAWDKIDGLLVYMTKVDPRQTKLVTDCLGQILSQTDDEICYFNLLERMVHFSPKIFARTIFNNNYISRHTLTPIGIERINELLPSFFIDDGKYHYIIPFIAEYNEYLTPDNRAYVISQSNKATKPAAIEAMYRVIGAQNNTQMIETCLKHEGTPFCFQVFWLLYSDKTFSKKYIQTISQVLEKKGTAGKLGAQILRKQRIDYKICPNNTLKEIKSGDYEAFARVVSSYDLKESATKKLLVAKSLEGTIVEMHLGTQMMHHYTFTNQDIPLTGILPRQCILDLPTKEQTKRCKVLKVLKEYKLMIITDEMDDSMEAVDVSLLNIGDEIELKFSMRNNVLYSEVVGCRYAKVKISNMPKQFNYKGTHLAIVLTQESFVDFVVELK